MIIIKYSYEIFRGDILFWDFVKEKEENKNTTPILVGCDLGYGQTKTFTKDKKFRFLSAVGKPISDFGRAAAVTNFDELLNCLTVTYEGQKYYIGHNAIVNSRNGRLSLRQNKADTEENKVKFLTSLALLMDEDQEYGEFEIVSGLPVLEFKNQKNILETALTNTFNLVMHYGLKTVNKRIVINNTKIISQGEGSFYDFVLDQNGKLINDRVNLVGGQVMVVDTGYRTTDIVTMESGRYLETMSDQINNGVNQMHQEILRLIMEKLNIKKELKDIDEMVRTRKIFHNKNEIIIDSIILQAAKPFAESIVEHLHTISNDQLGSMQRVILTGGGANLIYTFVKNALKDVIEVDIMENSEYSNASGYYKYGMLLKSGGQ